MNIEKFYCQTCASATLYTAAKPRFCSSCGESFAVFANDPTPIAKAAAVSKLKPASFYRDKVKPELEDEDEDDQDQDEGEMGEFGPDSGENIQSLFSRNLPKRGQGVKFGDIVKIDSKPNDSKPLKSNSSAKRKRGRPSKR